MKREILFKAKRVDNGEWVEGFYSPVNIPIIGNMGHFINEGGFKAIEVHPETVCQFTGMLDKNGNKIFEGDICLDMNEETRIIEYSYGAWSWNYYENPELDWKKTGNIHDK